MPNRQSSVARMLETSFVSIPFISSNYVECMNEQSASNSCKGRQAASKHNSGLDRTFCQVIPQSIERIFDHVLYEDVSVDLSETFLRTFMQNTQQIATCHTVAHSLQIVTVIVLGCLPHLRRKE